MRHAVDKLKYYGCTDILVTDRGTCFGYNTLVTDMQGLVQMREFAPVCFDATHAVQYPGANGGSSGGDRRFVAPSAARRRAAQTDLPLAPGQLDSSRPASAASLRYALVDAADLLVAATADHFAIPDDNRTDRHFILRINVEILYVQASKIGH